MLIPGGLSMKICPKEYQKVCPSTRRKKNKGENNYGSMG